MERETSEGEGACSSLFTYRSSLSLRGKLGLMTPRAGVKRHWQLKRASRGSHSQAGASLLYLLFPTSLIDKSNLPSCLSALLQFAPGLARGLPAFRASARRHIRTTTGS